MPNLICDDSPKCPHNDGIEPKLVLFTIDRHACTHTHTHTHTLTLTHSWSHSRTGLFPDTASVLNKLGCDTQTVNCHTGADGWAHDVTLSLLLCDVSFPSNMMSCLHSPSADLWSAPKRSRILPKHLRFFNCLPASDGWRKGSGFHRGEKRKLLGLEEFGDK